MSGGQPAQDDVIYCQQCGQQLLAEANFCDNCGAPVNQAPPQQPVQHAPDPQPVNGPPPAQPPSQPPQQGRSEPEKWRQWASISSFLAFVLLPIVFAPIAVYCGEKLKRYDEAAGRRFQAIAVVAVLLWIFILAAIL